jgi:hypothetical protein
MAQNNGFLCNVASYSTMVWYDTAAASNTVTMEFMTPINHATNGMLLCSTATGHSWTRAAGGTTDFGVTSLKSGGDQLATAATTSTSNSDANAAVWNHRAVEVGVAAEVLGTDSYYASSYSRARYDDITLDAVGTSTTGLFQDPVWTTTEDARLTASSAVITNIDAASTSSAKVAQMQTLAELNRANGNCALLTGSWTANTRYELVFTVPNPTQASGATNLGWWMAPISYAKEATTEADGAGGSIATSRITYTVHGHKHGSVCTTRYTVATALGTVEPSPSGAGTTITDCTAAPYSASTHAFGSTFVTTGACVACTGVGGTLGAGAPATACTCPSTKTTLVAGPNACGNNWSPLGTATSVATLAAELCTSFTAIKTALANGPASAATTGVGGGASAGAHAVANAHLDAFIDAAGPLADRQDVIAANVTYRASMMYDERASNDPSRKRGLWPNCASGCDDYGRYTDASGNTGTTAEVIDVQFDAVHALRLIGYVLNLKGYSCTALYDSTQTEPSIYGSYDAEPLCDASVPS